MRVRVGVRVGVRVRVRVRVGVRARARARVRVRARGRGRGSGNAHEDSEHGGRLANGHQGLAARLGESLPHDGGGLSRGLRRVSLTHLVRVRIRVRVKLAPRAWRAFMMRCMVQCTVRSLVSPRRTARSGSPSLASMSMSSWIEMK